MACLQGHRGRSLVLNEYERLKREAVEHHASPVPAPRLSHLRALESESIHIIREAVAESENPVLLFSGGKDSALVLRLAVKAFWPARLPFPVMHVDTGHNFDEVIEFRDRAIAELEIDLIVASVQEAIDHGRVTEETGPRASRNRLQTETLLNAIDKHRFDMVFGGARRDEEKARAKERVFSFRDEFGQWDPKNQRPELCGPLQRTPSQRRAHAGLPDLQLDGDGRLAVHRGGGHRAPVRLFLASPAGVRAGRDAHGRIALPPPLRRGRVFEAVVRFRTVGDMTCTGGFESTASSVRDIIEEVSAISRITERGASRADDRTADAAMEDRKREGYF